MLVLIVGLLALAYGAPAGPSSPSKSADPQSTGLLGIIPNDILKSSFNSVSAKEKLASSVPVHQLSPVEIELGSDGLLATISLGTPGQDFNVLVDTNVAGLWIPGSDCNINFDGASCDNKNVFEKKNSLSFVANGKNVTVPFRNKHAYGISGYDRLRFGPHYENGLTSKHVKFGVVNKLPLEYEDTLADGVLGLGLVSDNELSSPFSQLVKRGLLANPLLSIYVPRNMHSVNSPAISIGSQDLENCEKVDDYLPLEKNRNWAFRISGIFNLLRYRTDSLVATLDYTSDYIHVPVYLINELLRDKLVEEDPVSKDLIANCSTNFQLSFSIGKETISLTKTYLLSEIGSGYCLAKFKPSPKGFENEWRLGLPFLRQRCVVLDFNGKIGLATHENN